MDLFCSDHPLRRAFVERGYTDLTPVQSAVLAPATLGYFAVRLGLGVVMALPLAGMCTVLTLLVLIWVESKVTGR